jgi:3-oxoacyl-[acyl-carrier-protein] synthase-1
MQPLQITGYTVVNALGRGIEPSLAALKGGTGGLRPCDFDEAGLDTWIGRVEGLEEEPLTGSLAPYDCRNNRLARMTLEQDDFAGAVESAAKRYGPDRVGVFLGTSTSGIRQTELAYQAGDASSARFPESYVYEGTHNLYSLADFARRFLGLGGPALVVSTACSSSAKVFATAWRHIQVGLCEAAVVGGVDSLCLTTLYGFNSLELISETACRPWDVRRDGISIGEAGGFALLEKPCLEASPILLLGYGESSDAYHMSSPHPEGTGAILAMRRALDSAALSPADVDYINLHGTATVFNDAAEDRAVVSVFGARMPCNSTKGWTGHTLGAAGIVEAVFACLSIEHGFVPRTLNTDQPDPALSARLLTQPLMQRVGRVLSNSFGFGGNNCSLLLGRAP